MRIILLHARHIHRLVYKTEPVQRSYIFDITLELPESRLVSRLVSPRLVGSVFWTPSGSPSSAGEAGDVASSLFCFFEP